MEYKGSQLSWMVVSVTIGDATSVCCALMLFGHAIGSDTDRSPASQMPAASFSRRFCSLGVLSRSVRLAARLRLRLASDGGSTISHAMPGRSRVGRALGNPETSPEATGGQAAKFSDH